MNDGRGNWYLLTGLIIGLAAGVIFSWWLFPVKYVDTDPSSLSETDKDEYRLVIALAYQANHDIGRARERLSLINDDNDIQALAAQAQRMLGENYPPDEARALALLAADLGKPPEEIATPTPHAVEPAATLTPAQQTATPTAATVILDPIRTPTPPPPTLTPTVTLTPEPTFTLRPTMTATPTLSAPFALKEREEICGATAQPGLLQVEVLGPDDQPVPGVPIVIIWKNGEETFFTGLAPEISPGYADVHLEPGTSYTLRVMKTGQEVVVSGIREGCGLRLTFSQNP